MIESQRRLAALGLFRRVRITELPRTGSLTRDVLVDLEEADTDDDRLRRRPRGQRHRRPRRRRQRRRPTSSTSARAASSASAGATCGARTDRSRCSAASRVRRREPAVDNRDPTDTGGYGFNDYRGLFTFREPRAFGTTGDAQFTAFVEQSRRTSFTFNRKGVTADYARRLSARSPLTGRYTFDYTKVFDEQIDAEDQLLIDRLFPQVKLSKFFGAVLRDSRDDVLDPQTRRGDRPRRLGGRARCSDPKSAS